MGRVIMSGVAPLLTAPVPPPPCLTFSSPSAFSISVASPGWDGIMEYSTDKSIWTTWYGSQIAAADDGNGYVLYFRGIGNHHAIAVDVLDNPFLDIAEITWTIDGANVACTGNIESLLDYATVAAGEHPTMSSRCYRDMFNGCTSLISAPDLPATTLTDECYSSMFIDCTNLTAPPALPATTLATDCYSSMFRGCTSLTSVPALPATTLADYCYRFMFYGCTRLKLSATQTGNYTQAYRIPISGTVTTAAGLFTDMFTNTGGTFKGSATANTTYYLDSSNSIVP